MGHEQEPGQNTELTRPTGASPGAGDVFSFKLAWPRYLCQTGKVLLLHDLDQL